MTDLLRCPHCHAALVRDGQVWRCDAGHAFDVARQGYVNLRGGASPHTGDTAAMLDARTAVLNAGHLDDVTRGVVAAAGSDLPNGAIVEVGAGTAHHLAAVCRAVGPRPAVAMDASVAAAKRAARADVADLTSVVADVWEPWPLRDGVAALVLSIFAPRNLPEAARVLLPGGRLVVVTPAADHLVELARVLGLLQIAPDKTDRLIRDATPLFDVVDTIEVRATRRLDRAAARAIAAMGPSGFHLDPEVLAVRAAALPDSIEVTIAVTAAGFRRH